MSKNRVATRKPPPLLSAILPVVAAGMLAFATGAHAAEWVERPFDPPTPSRWIIQANETTEENRDGRVQTTVVTTTSELTIEQKIADGFRIAYVVRNAGYEGDPRTAFVGSAVEALENLVVHATTAPNGMPLRVENLAEVQAAARAAIDSLAAGLAAKPQEAAIVRRLATSMLMGGDKQAATVYLASLVTLALGQNTGLHPGETRRMDDNVANPLSGAPIKSNPMRRIASADPATGNVRYILPRPFDSDAIKDFLSKLARQLSGDGTDAKVESLMKQITFTIDSRAELDVEEGMTRAFRYEDTATTNTPGHSIVKHGHKLITVTPMP